MRQPVYLTHLRGVYISFSFICKECTQLCDKGEIDGVADGKFTAYLKCMQRPLDTTPLYLTRSVCSKLEKKALFSLGEAVGPNMGRAACGKGNTRSQSLSAACHQSITKLCLAAVQKEHSLWVEGVRSFHPVRMNTHFPSLEILFAQLHVVPGLLVDPFLPCVEDPL